jgi:putative oxidoreductase
VAVVLLLEMIWAFFQGHFPRGGWPVQNQGELALLYATIFAFLAAHGAGPFSLDEFVGMFEANGRRRSRSAAAGPSA